MLISFLHGVLLAFGLILPLGVQNVFIFNQGATHKRWVSALPAVITASICDSIMIIAAVLGVSVVVLQLGWLQALLTWGGAIFLLYMGWVTWRSNPDDGSGDEGDKQVWTAKKQILFAMSVSLLNPHAILDTIGVIGTSSLSYVVTAEKVAFTVACAGVSWLWFLGLMLAGHWVGSLEGAKGFRIWFNRVSAIIMWASAIYLIAM